MFDIFNYIDDIKFVPEIKVGDILTTCTILITLFSILYSLKKDRELRQKEQADKVRTAGARTIAKLDRWRDLSLGMFQYIQPNFVDASEKLSIAPNAESVRDFLWKKLDKSRIDTSEKILQENIETAYVDLYGYYPQIKPILEEVITLLRDEENLMFRDLQLVTQGDIGYFRDKKEGYRTAELGNRLREHSRKIRDKFEIRINNILNPVGDLLFNLILKSDKNLVVGHELISGEKIKFPSFDPDAYSDIVLSTPQEPVMIVGGKDASSGNAAAILAKNGKKLAQEGKLDEALQKLGEAIASDPNSSIAWNNKGFVLFQQKNYGEAVEAVDKAIEFDHSNVNAMITKGAILQKMNRSDEAINVYNAILSIDQFNVQALQNKGVTLRDQDKYDEAIESFDNAIQTEPTFEDAYFARGKTYLLQGDKRDNNTKAVDDYMKAVKDFEQATNINPKDGQAWEEKGMALMKMGRIDEANAAFSKAKELGVVA